MGDKSEIQWTDATWNPITGCSKVSPGCAHCYAETVTALRAGRPGFIAEHRPWTRANAAHNVTLWPERLDQPLRWRRPRMVFVNSMSDLFHEQVPDDYIADVFDVMARAPQHTFQVLTKRPDRMRALLTDTGWWGTAPPLPNVWLGVSIENRRFVQRADLLRDTPAVVRFISAEPLLGALIYDDAHYDTEAGQDLPCWLDTHIDDIRDLEYTLPQLHLHGIDWLIVGGESGPGHRRMRAEWAQGLRDAAVFAGAAFFFKQWGGATPKSGGRELDGRTWDEFPKTRVEA